MAASRPAAPPSPTGEAPARGEAWRDYDLLRKFLVAALVLACAAPLSLNLVDPDLWGHVRYGQDWIADGALPRTATHTYTAEGHPWVNHENLAEWLLARGFPAIGVTGMLVAKCLLGMAMLGMMWLVARRQGVRPLACWTLLLLVANNLQAFFPMRPQLLSFLGCSVMLLLLDRALAGWGARRDDFEKTRRKADDQAIDWRWLAPLPVLFAVWANSHGGFVAGLVILTAVLLGRAAQLALKLGSDGRRRAIGLLAVAIACGLATLINPYGPALHAWLLGSLGAARPEITEWGPPLPGSPVFLPFVALAVTAFGALLFTRLRRDPVQVVILALVGWQAASHLRHIAFFAILCGFWLPPHVQSIAQRLRNRAADGLPVARLSPWMRNAGVATLAAVIALQTFFVGGRVASLPVYRSTYPVDALQWMADERVSGKLVVCFNWAQYAIAALAPDVRVAFDGRFRTCYPQSVIDRHFDFLVGDRWPRNRSPESGPIDTDGTLEVDRPDYVLVDRQYPGAVEVMQKASEEGPDAWSLVYQDAVAQVWGRSEVVDAEDSPRHIPPSRRLVSERLSPTAVEWPALPNGPPSIHSAETPSAVASRADDAEDRPAPALHDG